MTVRCAQCGEEMLGAVNRCWKCGNPVVANAVQPDLPPQRRPADAPAAVQASSWSMVADAELVDEDKPEEADSEQTASDHVVNDDTVTDAEPPVRGSAPAQATSMPIIDAPQPYKHPVHHPTAATGGALGALLLGVISLVVSWFTVAGALLSLAGLGLGAWGASSNRRETAIIGMLLCCLALLISGYTGAISMYTNIYGYSPWESSMPVEDYVEPIDGETID